jgi:hypothetical protein
VHWRHVRDMLLRHQRRPVYKQKRRMANAIEVAQITRRHPNTIISVIETENVLTTP